MTRDAIAGLSTERLQRLTGLLEAYVSDGRLAGVQARVTRRGEIAYDHAFGLMDRERSRPWGDDTIVRIYSMTKPIVSVALMTLWERGRFQLDQPVVDLLPEWRDLRVWVSGDGDDMVTEPLATPITFRQLLSHTAGLTYGGLLETVGIAGARHPVDEVCTTLRVGRDPRDDIDAFIAKLGRAPLRYQPGARWMYSFASDVVGALVQRLSGRPLDRFLQEEIFGPLGMADTGFSVRPEAADRFAACYAFRPGAAIALQDDPTASHYLKPPNFFSGGGGLVSTMADYQRFCEMLRRGGELDGARVIGPRTLDLMTRNHLPGGGTMVELALDSFSETTAPGVGFGLGFAVIVDGVAAGSPSQGDFYWGGAASTMFWVDPKEQMTVILLAQLLPSTTYPLRAEVKNLVYAALED